MPCRAIGLLASCITRLWKHLGANARTDRAHYVPVDQQRSHWSTLGEATLQHCIQGVIGPLQLRAVTAAYALALAKATTEVYWGSCACKRRLGWARYWAMLVGPHPLHGSTYFCTRWALAGLCGCPSGDVNAHRASSSVHVQGWPRAGYDLRGAHPLLAQSQIRLANLCAALTFLKLC